MERRRDDAVANGTTNVRTADVVAHTVDPLLVLCRLQLVDNVVSSKHGLEIVVRRPNAMHAMLGWEFFAFDIGFGQARKPPADVFI